MNRDELSRAVIAACAHLDEPHVVVFGSQAILGSFDAAELPEAATRSLEVDLSPASAFHPGAMNADIESKLHLLDARVGEDSPFHEHFGVYVEGIHRDTVVLPNGWEDRLVAFTLDDGDEYGKTGFCLDPVDLCVAKAIAGREKDAEFVAALVTNDLIDPHAVLDRIDTAGIDWPAAYTSDPTYDTDVATRRARAWLGNLADPGASIGAAIRAGTPQSRPAATSAPAAAENSPLPDLTRNSRVSDSEAGL